MSKRTIKSTVNVKATEASKAPEQTGLMSALADLASKAAPIEPTHKRSGLTFILSADGQVSPDVDDSTSASGRRTAAMLAGVSRQVIERLLATILASTDGETRAAVVASLGHAARRVLRLWAVDGKPATMLVAGDTLPMIVANRGEIAVRIAQAKATDKRTIEQARAAIEARCLREIAFCSAAVNGALASAVADLATAVAVETLRAVESERKAARSAQRKISASERADMKSRESIAHATIVDAQAIATVAAEQATAMATEASEASEASAN